MKNVYLFTISALTCIGLLYSNATAAQLEAEGNITSGGLTRHFLIYVPQVYNADEAVPLVINLHGYTSNSLEQKLYTQFMPIADSANFILVYPDGTLDSGGTTYWNSFGLDGGVDDVGFINDLIDYLQSQYNIDSNCIYATGMSNGGYMSYELACQLSNRVAAIASVTGSMTSLQTGDCNQVHPTPVMQIHGTADGTVPYDGNFGSISIESLVDFWVQFNQCDASPVFEALPNANTSDNCTAEHYIYANGLANSSVEFYKIIGGDHSWPGAPININTTNQDFNASAEIWRFFSQYKLDELQVGVPAIQTEAVVKVFPNPSQGSFVVNNNQLLDRMELYDAMGRLLLQVEKPDNNYELKDLLSGCYVLKVMAGQKIKTLRLIVE
jgi:polyhydroxybutyrate depolymerase